MADISRPDNTTHCGVNQSAIIKKNQNNVQTSMTVKIVVLDEDDNPPVFRQKRLATGMPRQTEADKELEVHLRVYKTIFALIKNN